MLRVIRTAVTPAALVAACLVAASTASAHPGKFPVTALPSTGFLGLGAPLAAGGSAAAASSGVRVVGHVDPGGGFNADVVAHRGYAYLGSWGNGASAAFCPSQGVRVFSLLNAANPTLVSTFAQGTEAGLSLAGTWTEKVIVRHVDTPWFRGELAAVSIQRCATDGFRGLGLWDVTDPTRPRRLALWSAPAAPGGSHEIWLESRGKRAYVYTALIDSELRTSPDGVTPGQPDFRILDVSNPSAPTEIASWGAWSALGIPPRLQDAAGVPRANFVHSVTGTSTRAFLSYWDLGTVILDVTTIARPRYLGRTTFTPNEEGNAHSSWVDRRGTLLLQTDEDFSPGPGSTGTLEQSWGYVRLFDISSPSTPRRLSTFRLPSTTQYPAPPGYWSAHDPKVSGTEAFVSWYGEGVVVLDISAPSQPRQIAQFVPPPAADPRGYFGGPDVTFPHVWGTFVDGRNILASDINSGLWIFQLA